MLPTMNRYAHVSIKAGALETIIFDLERSTKADPKDRVLWLGRAKSLLSELEEEKQKLVCFEPAARYLHDPEEIVARQELIAEYGEREVMPEIMKEVFDQELNREETPGDLL